MQKTNRRSFLGLSAGAGVSLFSIGKSRADAPEFSYKWATNLAPSHPLNVRGTEAVERIKKETDGRLVIDIYPNNQLGADTDLLAQVRVGAIEFYSISPVLAATVIPPVAISGIGFAFKTRETAFAALDGDLGAGVRAEVEKTSLIALDKIFELGFREMTTSVRPVNTPDDLKGLKIRVAPGPLYLSLFQGIGASPVTINFNEVYSALQTKVVDGQDNPLALVQSQRFYEVQKYCSLTNHMWDGQWVFANKRAFQALPDNIQTIVRQSFMKAADDERADVAKMNSSIIDGFKQHGLMVNDADSGSFRTALRSAGYYKQWRDKFGEPTWRLLERYAGEIS